MVLAILTQFLRCHRALLSAGVLLFAIWTSTAHAQLDINNPEITDTRIRVSLKSPFSTPPFSGYIPIRATISNETSSTRDWHFEATLSTQLRDSCSFEFNQTLTVPPHAERNFDLLIPVSTYYAYGSSSTYRRAAFSGYVSGYGFADATIRGQIGDSSYASVYLPYTLFSPELYLRSWPVLNQQALNEKAALNGGEADLTMLPADWRAYSGVVFFFITAEEFSKLPANVEQSILRWVSLGGQLRLYHINALPRSEYRYGSLRIDPSADQNHRFAYGEGEITFGTWDGRELAGDEIQFLRNSVNSTSAIFTLPNNFLGRSAITWQFLQAVPKIQLAPLFTAVLLALLVVYAIIVGPVNLFVFANRSSRLHLFFTTPLISGLAAIGLAALLILREGVGGWGLQTTGVLLIPEAQTAIVRQEQLSRTALLFNTDFPLSPEVNILPLPAADYQCSGMHYWRANGQAGGDWFTNRSLQAHLVQASVPTRAQVTFIPGSGSKPPELFSSINATLETIYLADASGNYFRAANVGPGQRVPMQAVNKTEFREWVTDSILPLSGFNLQRSFDVWRTKPNVFFAFTKAPTEFRQETLPALDWRAQNTVFYGSLVQLQPEPLRPQGRLGGKP